jgi:hypothetical protein
MIQCMTYVHTIKVKELHFTFMPINNTIKLIFIKELMIIKFIKLTKKSKIQYHIDIFPFKVCLGLRFQKVRFKITILKCTI